MNIGYFNEALERGVELQEQIRNYEKPKFLEEIYEMWLAEEIAAGRVQKNNPCPSLTEGGTATWPRRG
jgi:hypothetical protein